MIDDSNRTYVRADTDTVLNILLNQQHPANAVEYPPDGILLEYPMTREEHMAWWSSWSHLRKQEWVL